MTQDTRRRNAPVSNPTVTDDQRARSALSLGKVYLKLKKAKAAREDLESVMRLAADSEMAKEARTLLDDLEAAEENMGHPDN